MLVSARNPHLVHNPSFEYEYIPDSSGIHTNPQNLESAFENADQLPASLRGEAVRSALTSGQCIALCTKSPVWRLSGEGASDFLKQKFTSSQLLWSSSMATTTCWLSPRGRVVDLVRVVSLTPTHFLILDGEGLETLQDLIFPMDQVTLERVEYTCTFDLLSAEKDHVQACWNDIMSFLHVKDDSVSNLSSLSVCLSADDQNGLVIAPRDRFPACGGVAYSLVFWGENGGTRGQRLWAHLTSDHNVEGPVRIGPLEYDTLRIELGLPTRGREFTAANKDAEVTPASPLELHLDDLIDTEKGCYMGQEGVASIVKNPRGPPRLLYQVIFDDDFNLYEHQTAKGDKDINLTKIPQIGDKLYVLGSNEEIYVATLTSVAEPGGTGRAITVALALARRPDSILSKMKEMGLSVPSFVVGMTSDDGSGLVQPPPQDPLHGVEVIVGGSYTVGRLAMVPSRRYLSNMNIFTCDTDLNDFGAELPAEARENASWSGSSSPDEAAAPRWKDVVIKDESKEDIKAPEESESDDAKREAERKAAKVEMLRKRAQEAMARRKQRQEDVEATSENTSSTREVDEASREAEVKRKEEKMETLRRRAEEAMARRKERQADN